MNVLSIQKKARILRALVEGCSIRSIERMTGHHRDTVMRVMGDICVNSGDTLPNKMQD